MLPSFSIASSKAVSAAHEYKQPYRTASSQCMRSDGTAYSTPMTTSPYYNARLDPAIDLKPEDNDDDNEEISSFNRGYGSSHTRSSGRGYSWHRHTYVEMVNRSRRHAGHRGEAQRRVGEAHPTVADYTFVEEALNNEPPVPRKLKITGEPQDSSGRHHPEVDYILLQDALTNESAPPLKRNITAQAQPPSGDHHSAVDYNLFEDAFTVEPSPPPKHKLPTQAQGITTDHNTTLDYDLLEDTFTPASPPSPERDPTSQAQTSSDETDYILLEEAPTTTTTNRNPKSKASASNVSIPPAHHSRASTQASTKFVLIAHPQATAPPNGPHPRGARARDMSKELRNRAGRMMKRVAGGV